MISRRGNGTAIRIWIPRAAYRSPNCRRQTYRWPSDTRHTQHRCRCLSTNASQFPAEYQGDAFVSMRGSWNRKPPSGCEVVRIEVHLLPSVDVHELGATIDPQSRRTTGVTTRLWLGKSCLARSIDSWQPAGKRPSASIETSRAWIRGGSATKVSKDPNVEPRNTTLGTERERAPHA